MENSYRYHSRDNVMRPMESMGPHRKGDSSAPAPGGVDCPLPGPQSGYHHPFTNLQSAMAVDFQPNTTKTACSPHPPCSTTALAHGNAAPLPRERQTPMVCAAQGNIITLTMLLFGLPPRIGSPSRSRAGFSLRFDKANWMPSRSYERTFKLF
jgi:hypothetical protein